eukprot:299086-Amorphochlora_amoeboformis.AAC.1
MSISLTISIAYNVDIETPYNDYNDFDIETAYNLDVETYTCKTVVISIYTVSYTHLRAHETDQYL